MASIAFGVVGAITGSFFGNWMTGWAVGTLVGGLLFPRGGGGNIDRGKLDDVRITASTYGISIPQVFGTMRVGGNIIWATDLREVVTTESQGGKGGGGGATVNTYSYFADVAVAICRGPITKIVQILAEREVVYDDTRTPKTDLDIEIHLGTSPQAASTFIEAALGAGNTPAYNGIAYVVFKNWDVSKYGNRIPNIEFVVETDKNTVQEVMEDVVQQCNISLSDCDFAAATDAFLGFIIPNRTDAKEAVRDLLTFGACDLIELDGKLKIVKRGGASARTLSDTDLGAMLWNNEDGVDNVAKIDSTRREEHELPTRIDLTYYSPTNNYQVANASSTRFTKNHINNQSVTMPMALTDDVARRLAERMMYEQYAERNSYKTSLPPKHVELAPSDIITLSIYGKSTRCRIVATDVLSFGEVALEIVRDDANVLTQSVTGATPDGGSALPFAGVAEITESVWIGTALRDSIAQDGRPGVYIAVSGPQGWGGAKVYISRDDGASYQVLTTIPEYTPVGVALTALSSLGIDDELETAHTVDVQFDRGVPSTVSYAELLAGSNVIRLGNEIVQYQTVAIIDASLGQYRLSNLLRGRRGTEPYMYDHQINEEAVLLWPSVQWIPLELALLNKTIRIRVVPAGGSFADYTDNILTVTGDELKPYSVTKASMSRDGTDIELAWVYRSRYQGAWADLNDAPMTDPYEGYEVDVLELDTTCSYVGAPPLGVVVDQSTPLSRSNAFNIPVGTYGQAWLVLTGTNQVQHASTLTIEIENVQQLVPIGPNGYHKRAHRLNKSVLTAINANAGGAIDFEAILSGLGSFLVSDASLILTKASPTIKRTLSNADPNTTYYSSDQVTDFGSAQSNLHFRIYQTNTSVGRGHALDLLIDANGIVWPGVANLS